MPPASDKQEDSAMERTRCTWCLGSELMKVYHDTEWGTPCREDRGQFEFLTLEAAQAGLSWSTILRKREGYREAFADFDPEAVARFTSADVERLMLNPGIVRNRLKIESAINNAQRFLEIAERYGSFSKYIWNFVDNKPVVGAWDIEQKIFATTPLSDRISKDLKKAGFKFMGSTIVYAHLQATGIVNDHIASCFRTLQL